MVGIPAGLISSAVSFVERKDSGQTNSKAFSISGVRTFETVLSYRLPIAAIEFGTQPESMP